MSFKRRLRKNEEGAMAVFAAICMVVLLGFAALTVDFGLLYYQKNKLQTACDAAALAAAQSLPNTADAEDVVMDYLAYNGFSDVTPEITYEDENTVIYVSATYEALTTFANILGRSSVDVSCLAGARKGSTKTTEKKKNNDIFDYALYSGSTSSVLNLGGNYYVYGKIHTNYAYKATAGSGVSYQITSVSDINQSWNGSGNANSWNAYTQRIFVDVEDAEGNVTTQECSVVTGVNGDWSTYYLVMPDGSYAPIEDYVLSNQEYVEMPYYLGDNISDIIIEPTFPTSYDVTVTSMSNLKPYIEAGNSNTYTVKYDISSTNGYAGYAIEVNNTICLDASNCSGVFKLQSNTANCVIDGDIYIKTNGTNEVKLYFGSDCVINGNIYCDGNLKLGGNNITINGNMYVDGNFSTDGSGITVNGDYMYATGYIFFTNTCTVAGAIVADGNITFNGGASQVSDTSSTLTVYSKTGNIRIANSDATIYGMIFAPYGDIYVAGNVTVYGNVIGLTISQIPANFYIYDFPEDRELLYDTDNPDDPDNSGDDGDSTPGKLIK